MSEYIVTPAYVDSMPVDISFVFADEKPAGKHGFCKPNGDSFCFEDGTPARFWGVNFNGGANFPEHDYAKKVARRLAQAGCNIVRFHQLDAEWDTPNIYSFTKGKRVNSSRVLDEESLDRLDYLIYALKSEGIYCYFDMMTYRKFKSGDDVPHADKLRDSAKPYSIFIRRLIDLQKEFCEQIWNRVNKYTGLAYKDDPVFVMCEITNECDLFNVRKLVDGSAGVPEYDKELKDLFKLWLKEKNIDFDADSCNIYENRQPLIDFKIDLTEKYYREIYDHMRSIGVKCPITGTNWTNGSPANPLTQRTMDFADGHHYYYDWRWGEKDKFCVNAQINGQKSILQSLGFMRLNNRPYFVSEWDMPWPNSYRAEGPIYYAALCALQGWAGMTIHTYAYSTKLENMNILGKEVSSSTIGGVPYREGIFSTWNDPAKFGLFYHSALMVRRADISPADKKIGVKSASIEKVISDAYKTGLEVHRLALVPDGEEAVGCDSVISSADTVKVEENGILRSDNGQLWRDIQNKFGAVDTDRTKIIYGTLAKGKNGVMSPVDGTEVNGMKIRGYTDFGVVALSSLTDAPIESSDNMLLSTIGRARNTNASFDGDKMISYGEPPILSEVIEATISIKTNRNDLSVWGVNSEGFYVGKVPAEYSDGYMTFTVGRSFPANYYLIVAE